MSRGLNHTVHGRSRGRPSLLLVHPLGADRLFWDACIAAWGPDVPVIACDLRSAGASPRSDGPVTLDRHARDLEELRIELGIHRLVLVGCAIGAMTAARYAALHPQSTAALVMASPTPRTAPAARAMLAQRADLVRRDGMAAILPGAVDKAFEGQPRDHRYHAYYQRFAAQDAQAYAASVQGILDADVSADLAALRCPTLVVAAGHDLLLPPAVAREVHGLVAGASFAQLDAAAHFAPYQQAQAFAALASAFLTEAGLL
jgi:3-oxoadipate enol-lactonase